MRSSITVWTSTNPHMNTDNGIGLYFLVLFFFHFFFTLSIFLFLLFHSILLWFISFPFLLRLFVFCRFIFSRSLSLSKCFRLCECSWNPVCVSLSVHVHGCTLYGPVILSWNLNNLSSFSYTFILWIPLLKTLSPYNQPKIVKRLHTFW